MGCADSSSDAAAVGCLLSMLWSVQGEGSTCAKQTGDAGGCGVGHGAHRPFHAWGPDNKQKNERAYCHEAGP